MGKAQGGIKAMSDWKVHARGDLEADLENDGQVVKRRQGKSVYVDSQGFHATCTEKKSCYRIDVGMLCGMM